MLCLALTGAGISGYLVTVALDPNKEVVCGPLGNCHTVQASQYAEVAGVPVAALGLLMYAGLVVLLATRALGVGGFEVQRALATLTFSLSLGGVVYSGYLTYLELAVIEAICIWCVTSAAIITLVLLMTLPDARAGRRSSPF